MLSPKAVRGASLRLTFISSTAAGRMASLGPEREFSSGLQRRWDTASCRSNWIFGGARRP